MRRNNNCLSCNPKENSSCLICNFLSDSASAQKLEAYKHSYKVKKGQHLYLEGAKAINIYSIYKGKIKVVKVGLDGKEQIVYLAKDGDLLGVKASLYDNYYSTTTIALEDTYICSISKEVFLELVDSNPSLNQEVRKYLCRMINIMEDKVFNLSQKSVRERLALSLLSLNETFGIENSNEILIDVSLTREDMANLVGTATETVIRLLSELKKEGIVNFSGKKLTIKNLPSLQRLAEL